MQCPAVLLAQTNNQLQLLGGFLQVTAKLLRAGLPHGVGHGLSLWVGTGKGCFGDLVQGIVQPSRFAMLPKTKNRTLRGELMCSGIAEFHQVAQRPLTD